MIVKKMVFKNFMAYYDEVVFEFPFSDTRNVTIIYAPNDVGKTCFFKGFMFGLYGPEKGIDISELINRNAFNEQKYEAYVSIEAEHLGNNISITRTIKPKGITGNEVTAQHLEQKLRVWLNGEEPFDNTQETIDFINSIVHKDAAKYFFFDGEKIDAYNIASGTDYKEAILRILGIKEIENSIKDFRNLEKEYENERDILLTKESQGNQLVQDKNDLLKEIDNFNKENNDFQNDLKDIQGRIVKHENQLSENEAIKVKIEEKKSIREKLKQLKDERDKIEAEKTRIFRENGTIILGTVLANELKPSVMNLLTEPSAVTPSHEFLDYLLEQVNCVCGSVMDDVKKENIKHSMQQFAQQDLDYKRANERKKWIQMLDKYPQHGANARLRYDEACKAKVRLNREINELEDREITVRSEVGNYNESTVQMIADEIARLEARQKEIERKIIRNITLVEERQIKLNQLENKIAKLNVSKEKEEAESRLAFARKVADALSEYQDSLIASKREEVERQSSHVFLQLTNKRNKYKSLKLNPSYQLLLEHSDGSLFEIERGRSLNPSTGQSKIISLSYIAGINKSTNAIAPVVIDNPVGLFSEEHRERVVKYLPQFGKQVMFMVTGADLGEQYRDLISPYVNRAYYLEDRTDLTWNKTQIARVEEM